MRMRNRGFVVMPGVKPPERSTAGSAGYDFYLPADVTLLPGDARQVDSGVRAYMKNDEVLQLHIRSSLGKRMVNLTNCTGIIDSDYFGTGNSIKIMLVNRGKRVVKLRRGDKIMQGIFTKYLVADDDEVTSQRSGGIGSTGR